MVSFPISHRVLVRVLLCGFVLAFTGVTVGGISNDEIDVAVQLATASLEREMTSLQEQLELFEMKHETLQAASEQFRIQSKDAKRKLEDERRRYDVLMSQKKSIEMSIESQLALALEDQKATFEDTVTAEYVKKRDLLLKENEGLSTNLRHAEQQLKVLEDSVKEAVQEQSKRSEMSEEKRLASEGKLRAEIQSLKRKLAYSDEQAKAFETSWKNSIIESEAKDEYFQEESKRHLEEASRWEQRLKKLNAESKDLFSDNKAKELELIRSKKLHLTLLEKLQESDESVKNHEAKIESITADIEMLSNDLKSTSIELSQSKDNYASLSDRYANLKSLQEDTELTLRNVRTEEKRNSAKKKELQSELLDLKFELETSQNKTKQTIEEKSEMTKTYTEALEQLSSKNNFLRHELVDIKFELERSQNETIVLRKETFETTNAHKEALDRLENEGRKLALVQKEYFSLKRNMDTMTENFKESQLKVKKFQQRIDDETSMNEELQKSLLYAELKVESSQKNEKELSLKNTDLLSKYEKVRTSIEMSERKVLEAKQQYEKSQERVNMLEESLEGFEGKSEEMVKQLELKVAKNSFLQNSLLDTRYKLEESELKVKLLKEQLADMSTSRDEFGEVEIESKILMERAQRLERELEQSNSLYDSANQKINHLQSQLNATETRSAQILSMFESMKEENGILSRNLHSSEEYKSEFYSATQQLKEKNESFEQCGNDLRDTQANYSMLKLDYFAAKDRIDETQKKVLLQEDTIKELKNRQTELEVIAEQREKQIEELEKPIPSEDIVTENENLMDVKSGTIEQKVSVALQDENVDTEKVESETTKELTKSETSPADVSGPKSTNGIERETQKRSQSNFYSLLGWLDYALYTILRVIVDLVGFVANSLWQILSTSSLFTPVKTVFDIVVWTMNELLIIHDALVSLFEFEMTFVSSLVSSEKDRSGFMFLIRHSEMFVMFGEAIGVLLCIDFIVSSFLKPMRARKRRPRAKTIPVPKTATASLLRKANNM